VFCCELQLNAGRTFSGGQYCKVISGMKDYQKNIKILRRMELFNAIWSIYRGVYI
jgi:hypothetical protein